MSKKQRTPSSDAWTWDLTQRECVRRGWHVERVDWRDRWGRSHDLFGVFDCLAWDSIDRMPGPTTYAIQFTGDSGKPGGNRAARRKKVSECAILPLLTAAGWVPLVWAWRIKDGRPVLAEDRVGTAAAPT